MAGICSRRRHQPRRKLHGRLRRLRRLRRIHRSGGLSGKHGLARILGLSWVLRLRWELRLRWILWLLARQIRIRGQLHRLARQRLLNRQHGLLGLIRIGRRLLTAGFAPVHAARCGARSATPPNDSVARPSQRHVQRICSLGIGVVRIHGLR